MPSGAINAQGSKLYIASGTSGAKTITAITQAYRAQVTSAAHGLSVGDRVTFAAVVGMTEINTLVGTVIAKDTNTFIVNIDSRTFTAYTSDGTATPVTYTQIKEVISYDFGGGERPDIDISNLESTAREYRLGLKDQGNFTCNISVVHSDAGQTACRTALGSDTPVGFKFELPNAEVGTFLGLVKSMPESGAVDATHSGSLVVRITGDIEWA